MVLLTSSIGRSYLIPLRITLVCLMAILLNACAIADKMASDRGVAYPLPVCQFTDQASPKGHAAGAVVQDQSQGLCVYHPISPDEQQPFARQAFFDHVERPFTRQLGIADQPLLGVALSGGGTKAAAVAMGVLAGLSDLNLLDKTDYLSTVSGGSYTGYFLYTHMLNQLNGQPEQISDKPLFDACVSRAQNPFIYGESDSAGSGQKINYLGEKYCESDDKLNLASLQQWVGCKQDVFNPRVCSFKSNGPSNTVLTLSATPRAVTAVRSRAAIRRCG